MIFSEHFLSVENFLKWNRLHRIIVSAIQEFQWNVIYIVTFKYLKYLKNNQRFQPDNFLQSLCAERAEVRVDESRRELMEV
jgi:hypothetical protein